MKFTFSIAVALLFASCSLNINTSDFDGGSWEKIKGNGNTTSEERSIDNNVDKIIISSSIDVVYTQGSPAKMVVEGEENLIDKVVTEQDGNTLKVYKKKNTKIWSTKKLRVLVTTPNLVKVSCSSSGDFFATNTLEGDELTLQTSSSGDIKAAVQIRNLALFCSSSGDQAIKGRAEQLEVRTSSSGDIKANELKTKYCKAATSSSGDISVHVAEAIEARCSSSGDITISGNPQKRDTKTSSSGDINFRN